MDTKGTLKIADFGLARDANLPNRIYSKDIVTLWYRPPEILLGSVVYSSAVDMCKIENKEKKIFLKNFHRFSGSAGCIFAEMLRPSSLFKGDCEIAQLFRIFQILGTPNDEIWPGVSSFPFYRFDFPQWKKSSSLKLFVEFPDENAEELLQSCLTFIPEKRLTAKQAREHSYFR